jgi:hypothetical protein
MENNLKKYIRKRDWLRNTTTQRMVNQPEIIDYIKNNPGMTENEIFWDIYKFSRGGIESNKKYAECLRRALHSGKIKRELVCKGNRKTFIYFISGIVNSK